MSVWKEGVLGSTYWLNLFAIDKIVRKGCSIKLLIGIPLKYSGNWQKKSEGIKSKDQAAAEFYILETDKNTKKSSREVKLLT